MKQKRSSLEWRCLPLLPKSYTANTPAPQIFTSQSKAEEVGGVGRTSGGGTDGGEREREREEQSESGGEGL